MSLMELSQVLGNFGEMLAAIVVVFTLGFLGLQLRQANRLAQAETHRGYASDWKKCMLDPYFEPSVNHVIASGIADFEQLADEGKRVFGALVGHLNRCHGLNRSEVTSKAATHPLRALALLQERLC